MSLASQSRRKRSGKVKLTRMVALSSTVAVAACGGADQADQAPQNLANSADWEEVQVFENAFECASKTDMSREECEEVRQQAIATSKETAPRYAAIQDCEAEHGEGRCVSGEPTETHRRTFSPFLAAFVWSRTTGAHGAPLFGARGGGYTSASGMKLGYAGQPGKYYAAARAFEAPKSAPAVKPASKLAQSGGFGERNRSWNLRDRNGGSRSSSYSRGG